MAVSLGEDAIGPDVGLDPYNLDPRTGLGVARTVQSIPTVTQMVFPENSSSLIAPISTTAAPRGAQYASLAPEPGQAVDLLPKSPVELSKAFQQVDPVVPKSDIAPQVQGQIRGVQVAQAGPGQVALPQAQPVPVGGQPGQPGPNPARGTGVLGSNATPAVPFDPNEDPAIARDKEIDAQIARQKLLTTKGSEFWTRSVFEKAQGEIERLQKEKLENQKAIQEHKTNLDYARNLNLIGPVSSTQNAVASNEQAVKEFKDGNYQAYLGLKAAGQEARGQAVMGQAMQSLDRNTNKATELFAKLDNASGNANDYAQKRAEVIGEIKNNPMYKQYNLTEDKIPTSNIAYGKSRELLHAPLKEINQVVMNYKQQVRDMGNPVTLTGDAATGVTESSTFSDGSAKPKAIAKSLPHLGGQKATLIENALPNPEEYRKGGKWTNWNDTTQEVARKMISENPEVKGVLDQHNMAIKFNDIVQHDANYNDSTGRTMIADGAAGVFRNMSEMARAAGNIGLIRVWEHEMGILEKALNQAYTNWGTYKDWLNNGSKGDAPDLVPREQQWSDQTKASFKRIGKFNLDKTAEQLPRASGVARYVGKMAGDLESVGVSPDAAKELESVRSASEHAARVDYDRPDRLIIKNKVFELGPFHNVDEKTPGFIKGGSFNESWRNTNSRAAAPATTPPPPATPPVTAIPSGPASFGSRFDAIGGAPAPVVAPPAPAPGRRSLLETINPISPAHAEEAPLQNTDALRARGLDALRTAAPAAAAPAGFEPQSFAAGIGRGESNNNYAAPPPRDHAGVPMSSASGKYQMIDDTWMANRPPGSTATRAMDATPAEQDTAFKNLTDKNTVALKNSGIPVNNFTMAVAHQLGAGNGGAASLLTAPDGDTALKYVNRASANNNKPFFWEGGNGRLLTVAESKAKYAQFYNTGAGSATSAGKPVQDMTVSELRKSIREGRQLGEADKSALQGKIQRAATDAIPAAGQTAGYVAGGAVGGPAGAMIGSSIGNAAGNVAKDYLSGNLDKQDAASLALSGAGGAVEGAIMGSPLTGIPGVASRVAGVPTAAGVTDYLQTGDPRHALNKAVLTGAGVATGEIAGGVINKALAPYLERIPIHDHDVVKGAAEVIATQKPGIMDARGNTTLNPAYRQAEQDLISRGLDPKRIAADVQATKTGTTEFGPAVISRPAEAEKLEARLDLDRVVKDAGAAHAAVPAGQRAALNANLGTAVKSPMDVIVSDTNPHGAIPRAFKADAQIAHDEMFKPSTNYGQVIDNFATARSNVLEKIRNTEAIPAEAGEAFKNKQQTIRGLTAVSDHIRKQQETIIDHLLPPQQATALKEHLHQAGERYYRAVTAGGKDIVATIAKGGKDANEARDAFMAVAKNDPTAQRWMNAMVEAEKNKGGRGKDLIYIMASSASAAGAIPFVGVPAKVALGTVAATISLPRIKSLVVNYMTMKGAGKLVNFDQLVRNDVTPGKQAIQRGMSTLGGTVGGDIADQVAQKPTVENRGARVPISQ